MRVDISQRRMQRFWAAPNPTGKTYPIGMAPLEHTKLANFAWFDYVRPQSPDDLFEWRPKHAAEKLKVKPRRKAPLQMLQTTEKTQAAVPTAKSEKTAQP